MVYYFGHLFILKFDGFFKQIMNYSQRARLRSVYFQAIRTVLRDFNFNLNRTMLLRKSGMENIDNILFKRSSTFILGIYFHLEPTNLAGRMMSRGYFKERQPFGLCFLTLVAPKLVDAVCSIKLESLPMPGPLSGQDST